MSQENKLCECGHPWGVHGYQFCGGSRDQLHAYESGRRSVPPDECACKGYVPEEPMSLEEQARTNAVRAADAAISAMNEICKGMDPIIQGLDIEQRKVLALTWMRAFCERANIPVNDKDVARFMGIVEKRRCPYCGNAAAPGKVTCGGVGDGVDCLALFTKERWPCGCLKTTHTYSETRECCFQHLDTSEQSKS